VKRQKEKRRDNAEDREEIEQKQGEDREETEERKFENRKQGFRPTGAYLCDGNFECDAGFIF
jgi:hypothetical protein